MGIFFFCYAKLQVPQTENIKKGKSAKQKQIAIARIRKSCYAKQKFLFCESQLFFALEHSKQINCLKHFYLCSVYAGCKFSMVALLSERL